MEKNKKNKKKWKTTSKNKKKKKEDDLKKNGRQPQTQFKKSSFIGCDKIVNYPSIPID